MLLIKVILFNKAKKWILFILMLKRINKLILIRSFKFIGLKISVRQRLLINIHLFLFRIICLKLSQKLFWIFLGKIGSKKLEQILFFLMILFNLLKDFSKVEIVSSTKIDITIFILNIYTNLPKLSFLSKLEVGISIHSPNKFTQQSFREYLFDLDFVTFAPCHTYSRIIIICLASSQCYFFSFIFLL